MIDLDRAVLYFGIAAVMAVATFNHVHAHAAQPQATPAVLSGALDNAAVEMPSREQPLPRGYWTAPATSPLQGVGLGLVRAAEPLAHPGHAIPPSVARLPVEAVGF